MKHESEREQEGSTRHVCVEVCPPTAEHKARSEKTDPHLVEASSGRKTIRIAKFKIVGTAAPACMP